MLSFKVMEAWSLGACTPLGPFWRPLFLVFLVMWPGLALIMHLHVATNWFEETVNDKTCKGFSSKDTSTFSRNIFIGCPKQNLLVNALQTGKKTLSFEAFSLCYRIQRCWEILAGNTSTQMLAYPYCESVFASECDCSETTHTHIHTHEPLKRMDDGRMIASPGRWEKKKNKDSTAQRRKKHAHERFTLSSSFFQLKFASNFFVCPRALIHDPYRNVKPPFRHHGCIMDVARNKDGRNRETLSDSRRSRMVCVVLERAGVFVSTVLLKNSDKLQAT